MLPKIVPWINSSWWKYNQINLKKGPLQLLCVNMFLLSLPWCLRTPVAWVLQFMSVSTSISTYTQANNIIVGPALVAFRSVDVPITRKTLTEDKS